MKFSFYRNLTWLIGILVAVEIFLKFGLHKGIWLMAADLVIVLILTFLFHRLKAAGASSGAFDPDSVSNAINTKSEAEWQKKHDLWWQAHHQMTLEPNLSAEVKAHQDAKSVRHAPARSSYLNVDQLKPSNQKLKKRINYLNHKIEKVHDDQKTSNSSYQDSDWYRQVQQMRRQIAKLKSEYK